MVKEVGTIREKHLTADTLPVRVCVDTHFDNQVLMALAGSSTRGLESSKEELKEKVGFSEIAKSGSSISFNEAFMNNQQYIFSKIDKQNKFSVNYYDCCGMIGVGKSSIFDENISFLTHYAPSCVLESSFSERFRNELRCLLKELEMSTIPGTVDVCLFGGRDKDSLYSNCVSFFSKLVVECLGFEPVIIMGPKSFDTRSVEDAYFDTKNRLLYVLRDTRKLEYNRSFSVSEILAMPEID